MHIYSASQKCSCSLETLDMWKATRKASTPIVLKRIPEKPSYIKKHVFLFKDDEDEDDTETCTSPEVCAPQPFPRHTAPQQQTPKPWKRTGKQTATLIIIANKSYFKM